jgi:serine/threonine protein phosphatase PrpC
VPAAAERIGVFAEPEVVTKQLQPSHAFMVLASDGVWEFLPSQSVVDMVSKFDDPQVSFFTNKARRAWGARHA